MTTAPGKRARASATPARRKLPGEVRLIGGQWKRTKLPVLDRPGLRPTSDRLRETLFNWLGQDLTGWRCLDAFAGSGALGFEAASRGAADVVMLERDAALVANLLAVQKRLGAKAVQVTNADAIAWMNRCPVDRFELVLLDPPFDAGLHVAAVQAAASVTAPGGFVYVESSEPLQQLPAGLEPWRKGRAGAVHVELLRCSYTGPVIHRGLPT